MTTQQVADAIIYPYHWQKETLTYSFKTTILPYELNSDFQGSQTVGTSMKNATHTIFDYLQTLLDINFIYTEDIGDIVISSKDIQECCILGYTYMPIPTDIQKSYAGDIYIDTSFTDVDFQKGGMGYATLLHEIGHALGLNHPYGIGDYHGINVHDTIMSYNPYEGYDNTGHYYNIQNYTTLQSADIQTLQSYYGANTTLKDNHYDLGNMLYNQPITNTLYPIRDGIYTIDDQNGTDTLLLQNLQGNQDQYLNLTPATISNITNNQIHHYLTLTDQTIIENLIGSSGNDTIILNDANNTIDTKDGYDTIIITNQGESRIDYYNDTLIVSNKTSGFDILYNIEELNINGTQVDKEQFTRESIVFEDFTSAEQLSRLYLSALNRLPDRDGLEYWIEEYQTTHNLNAIANAFIYSDEFITLYGQTQSSQEYINLLYNNILYRDADEEGLHYWKQEMQNGASKADILLSFSTSDEFIDLTGLYFENQTIAIL